MAIKFYINKNREADYIYKQIYNRLKDFILKRTLNAHQKLPSKRNLAHNLRVGINSITYAYEQLIEEGYIYAIERKGYFVEDISYFENYGENDSKSLPKYLQEKMIEQEGWLSLSHIKTNSESFPFSEWVKAQKKAIYNHKKEISDIPRLQGPILVREKIAKLIKLTRGVECYPEQIIINTGIHLLINQLMSLPGLSPYVAMENPGYTRIYSLLKKENIVVKPINLDDSGINIEKVKRDNFNFIFTTPSHQFPTGKIMSISRKIDLLNWAGKNKNRYIIEDDYDSEFKYGTDNIPSLHSLDKNNRVIYFGAFSKTLLPSLRISYMVLPPYLLGLYRNHYSNWIHGCNTLDLYTLYYFIDSGSYAKHIKKMNQNYNTKRKIIINELQYKFQKEIYIECSSAGLHFLAHFNSSKSYQEIIEDSKTKKLEIYTIKHFLINNKNIYKSENRITLIIGFAYIKLEDIPEAVSRLFQIIKK